MTDLSIGERIMILRKRRGLSMKNLAQQIGISPATLAKYENDEITNHSVDILLDLAVVLGTTVNEIVTGLKEPPDPNNTWFLTSDEDEI